MVNLFNRIFYNKKINKKTWLINGVETDPTQTDKDDDIKISDTKITLTISKEVNSKDIITTIQVKDQEFSFILYDEVIKYINDLGGK